MSNCVRSIFSVMNRCVVFNTDAESYHGHPDPLLTPPGVKRRSLALYYYTASKAVYSEVPNRSTMYHARPGDSHAVKREVAGYRTNEYLRDYLPPVLFRLVEKVRWRLQAHRRQDS